MEGDPHQQHQNTAHQNGLSQNEPDQSRSHQIEPDRSRSNGNEQDRSAPKPTIPSPDASSDVLTIDEVQALWEKNEVYRNTTTLRKYCRLGRIEGCFKIDSPDGQDPWVAPREHALKYLEQVKSTEAAKQSNQKNEPDRSAPKSTEPVQSGSVRKDDEIDRIKQENRDLQLKNRKQLIDILVKDKQIENHMKNEERFLDRLTETSRTVGVLETKLQQYELIEAPKSEYKVVNEKHDKNSIEGEGTVFENINSENSPERQTGV